MYRRIWSTARILAVGLALWVPSTTLAQVTWSVSTNNEEVRECFQQHMLHVPGWEATYLAHVTVDERGATRNITFEGLDANQPLQDCLLPAYGRDPGWRQGDSELVTHRLHYRVQTGFSPLGDSECENCQDYDLGDQIDSAYQCFRDRIAYFRDRVSMVAAIELGTDGRVVAVEFPDSPIWFPELHDCVREAIVRWEFPPQSQPIMFELPLGFTAYGGNHHGRIFAAPRRAPLIETDAVNLDSARFAALLEQVWGSQVDASADGSFDICVNRGANSLPQNLRVLANFEIQEDGTVRSVAVHLSADEPHISECLERELLQLALARADSSYAAVIDWDVTTQRFEVDINLRFDFENNPDIEFEFEHELDVDFDVEFDF